MAPSVRRSRFAGIGSASLPVGDAAGYSIRKDQSGGNETILQPCRRFIVFAVVLLDALFDGKICLPPVRLTDVPRFQMVGEALAIAALSASAVAQNAQAPISTPTGLEAALQACWVPPPMEQSRPGMQITVLMSFKRNGELFEQPRIVFQSREASDTQRSSYRDAVAQMLKRCASLPFTEALGNIVAGQPFTMTFTDDREQNP
jgi:hypothetical protein